MDSCLAGHVFLKLDTRTIKVGAGRASGAGQSVRNRALRCVAETTFSKHLYALRFADSIAIDAPECTQSMRQRSELCAILRLSSFVARPRLFTVVCSPCLYRPGCYWPLLSRDYGIARGFQGRAAWRLYSCSAPEFRRTALRQRNLAASRSMFMWIDVGFRVLFRAARGQSVHLDRSVIFPKLSPRR